MPEIEDQTRRQIAEFLPEAIEKALFSYQLFTEEGLSGGDDEETADKVKDFKARHDACKVAVAHIELLIKLARWADLPDEQAADNEHTAALAMMIESAQSELDRYQAACS